MAEFKLGRIKFVWKGGWVTGTQYYVDDVIRVGGKVYICVVGHTSAPDFYTDLDNVPTRWNLLTDGTQWLGDWTTSTNYRLNDLVKYGGLLYICNDPHLSASTSSDGLEVDQLKWTLYAESLDWKEDWTVSTRYKVNDLVRYGGYTYVCNEAHTSDASEASGLEADQSKWDTFNPGIEYKGDWSGSAVRYKVNDVVKYGAGLWICDSDHTSTASFISDEANWNRFVDGVEFEDVWSSSTVYQPGDVVRYGGNQYVAKINHSNAVPSTETTEWDLFLRGFSYQGDWVSSTSYKIGEVIALNGYTYVALQDVTPASLTITASNASSPYQFTTSGSTVGLAANMAVRFSGTTFGDVNTTGVYYIKTIESGTEFTVSQLPGGDVFQPTAGSGSMTATVVAEPPHATYWDRLNSGFYWKGEWTDDTQYVVGDVVRQSGNAYICILAHRSEGDDGSTIRAQGGGADLSRPDLDTSGTYWNLLTIGSETSVLIERGDLVYFGGAGPTRLPIGREGQILRAGAEYPEWVTLGEVDHVYFVSTHGTDSPAPIYGKTFDKPWKTIRYACEQVLKGPRNPNTQKLLELNRSFIQREVTEWIKFQIANNLTPFTSAFVYNDNKCERDTGFIVDALIHDLGHGGNVRTRGAALTYVNAITEDSPGSYLKLGEEKEEDIAAYTYMLTLVEKVLNQEAPTTNYQTTNGDNSTSVVAQYFNADIEAEDGVFDTITDLVGIITTAIQDEDADRIPARLAPANLIRVATGRYREVLPIIVPEHTCVQGDELRSTNAGPAAASDRSLNITDAKYSIGAFGRLESVISDIVQGSSVTPSSGNTESQDIAWPFAEASDGNDVARLARTIQHNVDFRLGTMHMASLTDPTGYNSSFLNGYGNARKLLKENKKFMQEEVISYIAANYPNIKYSRTSCRRDVGYIVDAMIYDLTYGGYTQSLNAGLAYYDGPGSTYAIDSSEITATLASYAFLSTLMQDIAENTAVTPLQVAVPQYRDTAGSAASASFIGDNMDIIYNILGGDSSGASVPSVTVTDIATNVITTSANHGLGVGDNFIPLESTNNLVAGKTYWILTTPGADTFTISESFNGSTHVLNDGSSLTIPAKVIDNPVATDGVTTTTALIGAFTDLSAEVDNLKYITTDYISANYGNFSFDSELCERDSRYLIEAAYYDAAFGSNFWAVQNGLAYYRDQASTVLGAQYNAEVSSINYIKTRAASSLAHDATAVSRSNSTYVEILDILANGIASADALVYTNAGNPSSNNTIAREELVNNRAFIISEISAWLADPGNGYDSVWTGLGAEGQATYQRDFGYTIDGLAYDAQYGGNLATRNIARSLFDNRTGTLVQPAGQRAASAAAYAELGNIVAQIVRGTYVGQDSSAGDAGATLASTVEGLADEISGVITAETLSGLVAESQPSLSWVDADIQLALSQLADDKNSIISDTTQHVVDNFSSFRYNVAKCRRDVEIIINAMGYDFMFNSNYQTLKAAYAYLRATASDVYDGNQKTATRASFTNIGTLIANDTATYLNSDSTAESRIATLFTLLDDVIFSGSNDGSVCATERRTYDYAVLQLERNRDFIVQEIDSWIAETYSDTVSNTTATSDVITISDTSWLQRNAAIRFTGTVFGGLQTGTTYYVQKVVSSTTFTVALTRYATDSDVVTLSTASGSATVALYYNSELCLRDVNEIIDAIKYDTKYPGNYRSLLCSRYYANAVTGSLEEDMFYLRDATGIRDMTLEGLTGDLTPENDYGTSRVTAGAYASLDPGWGPDDFRAWIITRSPYVQGVTTFGTACIGQKIDGALHNGGNDSIVSNDFTQVLSDGIGAWVANNGRAELVSVFTYYAHIGYLSTEGGRIRGTNGNNSYGDWGAVAEGVDSTEAPGTSVVNNRAYNVTVGSVTTDGSNQVFNLEFDNAGNDYTELTWTITGPGLNASAVADDFRDGAVFETFLLDNVDDSANAPEAEGNFGGFGYITNSNTAQTGSTTQITIAATDGELSSAYVGMKIFLTGGTGAGQYGIIDTYNSGTKIATVVRESNGAAGWDHVISGTTIVSPDSSTTYTIEPAVSFTAPGYTASARTLSASLEYKDVVFAELHKDYQSVSGITDGVGSAAAFTVAVKGNKYGVYVTNAGTNYARLDTITISGADVGGASPANDITVTITSVNSVTGSIQAFEAEGQAIGGRFVAIADTTDSVIVSTNGTSWTTVSSALPGTTEPWIAIASGKSTTAVAAGTFVVGNTYTIVSLGNSNFTLFGASANVVGQTFVATDIGSGTGTALPNLSYVVAIEEGGVTAYSTDAGLTWSEGDTASSGGTWKAIAYGDGTFAAVAGTSQDSVYSTDGGQTWTATSTAQLASNDWTGISYGKGIWVAVSAGGTAAASSTDLETWTPRSLPTSTDWTSVAYGNNRFVAVSATSGTDAAYSLNGTSWTTATLPATATWSSIRYGQGVFLAVASGSTDAGTSEDGIVWTSRAMSTSANGYSRAAFGNPNSSGIWAAVQAGAAGTVGSSVVTGARAKARAFVAETKIFVIRMTDPGSGYSTAPTVTITDPNPVYTAPTLVRIGNGVVANPSFINRGTGYVAADAEQNTGNGYADRLQSGAYVAVKRLNELPVAGSNVVFDSLPGQTFKLVNVLTFIGEYDGSYTAFLQVSPEVKLINYLPHNDGVETRIRYSQVRLTGHDFLDIGTGSFAETNYPDQPTQAPNPARETNEDNGGRVFYTSTDQDGNFRVGGLFTIEQSTGIATLNADAFNIAGLQELSLGEVTLGGGSATITEFSTDPFFTLDSDTVVPTQRAIKAYISAQIGGGGASLNVNSVTAGSIFIAGSQITHTTDGAIAINARTVFSKGVRGYPIAWNYFLV